MHNAKTNILIIGAGIAGLTAALHVADHYHVTLICNHKIGTGASMYAQGGIAAVADMNDSIENHIKDTLEAGSYHNDYQSVLYTVSQAPKAIQWLIDQGVRFTKESSEYYHLHQEGGHTHRRIFHAKDATGRAIQKALVEQVERHSNINVLDRHLLIDLLKNSNQVQAASFLHLDANKIIQINANAIVLATGGSSNIYQHTTQKHASDGDGIACAYRIGACIKDMEFNQFHPTALYTDKAPLLLSEALRGEGAHLVLKNGTRFMPQLDFRAELAPRDIVAQSIMFQMKTHQDLYVYLDITHKDKAFIIDHFPMLYERLMAYGYDLTKDKIPVVPAAHYTCGGILVDKQARTTIDNLYAIGEASCTGLHGANRLASNSLSECVVYAFSAARNIASQTYKPLNAWSKKSHLEYADKYDNQAKHTTETIQRLMFEHVGVIRTFSKLLYARQQLIAIDKSLADIPTHIVSKSLVQVRNLCVTAKLVVDAAIDRKESLGSHYIIHQ